MTFHASRQRNSWSSKSRQKEHSLRGFEANLGAFGGFRTRGDVGQRDQDERNLSSEICFA